MVLSLGVLRAWLDAFAQLVDENLLMLDELDAALGDGDHGSNLARGLHAALAASDAREHDDVADLFAVIGIELVAVTGGASGTHYGTFLLRFGMGAGAVVELDAVSLGRALRSGLEGVVARGTAEQGDKTMVDALLPALAAYDEAVLGGLDVAAAAAAAAAAAQRGSAATAAMRATTGLAAQRSDAGVGHIDPGAESSALLVRALESVLAS
jgi:phosphoenolpyruvate---glycerone phosphotransferase subunit DhaL